MTRVRLTLTAEPDTRFDRHAFDGNVGKSIRLDIGGVPIAPGVLNSATVEPDGLAVHLVVELPYREANIND